MSAFLSLLSIVLLVWIWIDSIVSKELAIDASRKACKNEATQLLDQTVEYKKFWLRFEKNYPLQIFRLYFFEYTLDGTQRFRGRIVLAGRRVVEVNMNAFDQS